jgi:hypothetical protein
MVQTKCKSCQNQFTVTNDELDFYDQVSPILNGKKFEVPPPTLCPLCRQQLRMSFRNERKLYKGKSAFSGKEIISMYSPDKGLKVVDRDEWWGDSWSPLEYGRDFDFNRTFAEQFKDLYKEVPHIYLQNTNTENSYYTNYALNHKDCYLIFGGSHNEQCLYGKFLTHSTTCVDTLSCHACELCYEGIACERCYNCRYLKNCRGSHDCTFIEDCTGCTNCIACFGLKLKENCFANKQLSKSEFEKIKEEYKELTPEKIEKLKKELGKLKASLPHPHAHIYNCENSTGEFISNCKNCKYAFDANENEDCKYIYFCPKAIHSQDCTFNAPIGPELCYNLCSTVALKFSMANFLYWYGESAFYCMECHHSNNVFGCVSLRHNNYCILNKQYSKEEYFKLIPLIIEHMKKTGEWGEYLNKNLSAFSYNETIAQEYFPLTKEEALKKGWSWKDEEKLEGQTNENDNQPSKNRQIGTEVSIKDPDEKILNTVFRCEKTSKAYKVIPEELKFYRTQGLPLPTVCPDERHYARVREHNILTLFTRKCDNCKKEIQTTHQPFSQLKILCEDCYLKEVY